MENSIGRIRDWLGSGDFRYSLHNLCRSFYRESGPDGCFGDCETVYGRWDPDGVLFLFRRPPEFDPERRMWCVSGPRDELPGDTSHLCMALDFFLEERLLPEDQEEVPALTGLELVLSLEKDIGVYYTLRADIRVGETVLVYCKNKTVYCYEEGVDACVS